MATIAEMVEDIRSSIKSGNREAEYDDSTWNYSMSNILEKLCDVILEQEKQILVQARNGILLFGEEPVKK